MQQCSKQRRMVEHSLLSKSRRTLGKKEYLGAQ
jgi:hypothetical protein